MIDKKEIVDFIMEIYAYSQTARIRGLLSLEEFLEDTEKDYFREGLEQVMIGTDPVEVAVFCKNFILKAQTPDEKLFREIAGEGIVRIQCGDQSPAVWLNLANMIGPEGYKLVKERLLDFEKQKNTYFNTLKTVAIQKDLADAFENIVIEEFIFMPGSVLILVDCFTLATALTSCTPILQARILHNLPMNEMRDIMKNFKIAEITPEKIEESIKEIIELYNHYQ